MAKIAWALSVFLFLHAGAARALDGESGGEAVVRDFAGRMVAGDFGGALALFRFRLQAENIDHVKWIEALSAVYPDGPLPVRYRGYVDINAASLSKSAVVQLRNMIYSLLLTEKYPRPPRGRGECRFPGDAAPEDVERENAGAAEMLNPRRLAELKLLRLERTAVPDQSSARMRSMRGIDEVAEFLLLYEFNGRQYRGAASTYRFGDDWCMGALSATGVSDLQTGMLVPAPPEEYDTEKYEARAANPAAVLSVSAPARSGEGHAGPEELIGTFCALLGDGDFAGVLRLLPEMEEPDFARAAALRGGIFFHDAIPAPGYLALNGELVRNNAMTQIRMFLLALLANGPLSPLAELKPLGVAPGPEAAEAMAAKFAGAFAPDRLKTLRLIRLDRLTPAFPAADGRVLDYAEFMALYEFEDGHRLGSATMCRFADGWRLMSPFSFSAVEKFKQSGAAGRAGNAVPEITPEAYAALLTE